MTLSNAPSKPTCLLAATQFQEWAFPEMGVMAGDAVLHVVAAVDLFA